MGQRLFSLKSQDNASSIAIILSFDAKWMSALEANGIDIVFRKMGPKKFEPMTMYAYMAKPISAIVARIRLTGLSVVAIEEAVKLVNRSGLNEAELRAYAANYSQILVYEIESIEMAKQKIQFDKLRDDFNFWPSSNYIPLSTEGIEAFDSLGVFSRDKPTRE